MAQSYQVADAESGEILSKHRTQQAALDAWLGHPGRPIRIFHLYSSGELFLLAEGVWHGRRRVKVPVTRLRP